MTLSSVERPLSRGARERYEESYSDEDMDDIIFQANVQDEHPQTLDRADEEPIEKSSEEIMQLLKERQSQEPKRSASAHRITREERPDERFDAGFTFVQNKPSRFTPMPKTKEPRAAEGVSDFPHLSKWLTKWIGNAEILSKERPQVVERGHAPPNSNTAQQDEDGTLPSRMPARLSGAFNGRGILGSSRWTQGKSKDLPSRTSVTEEPGSTADGGTSGDATDHTGDVERPRESAEVKDHRGPRVAFVDLDPQDNLLDDRMGDAEQPAASSTDGHSGSEDQDSIVNTEAATEPALSNDGMVPSKENLFALILYRMQEEEKAHAAEAAQYKAQVIEAHEVKEANGRLLAQLSALREQEQAHASETADLKQTIQTIKEKFRKAGEFLNGLTNDHNSLKGQAMELTRAADSARKEGAALRGMLDSVVKSLRQSEASRCAILSKAKAMISTLESTIRQQQDQLENQKSQIQIEHDRNELLASQLSELSEAHRGILTTLEGNTLALGQKIEGLPTMDAIKTLVDSAMDQNELKMSIGKVLDSIEAVRGQEVLGSSDLQFLRDFVQDHETRMKGLVQEGVQGIPDYTATHSQILDGTKELQTALENITVGIRTEKDLSSEIASQSQKLSSMQQELQLKDAALQDAKHRIGVLTMSESQGFQERQKLKQSVATLQARPVIDPETPRLLREQELQSTRLQSEVSRLQEQLASAASAAQLHHTSIGALQQEVTRLRQDLQASECKAATLTQDGVKQKAAAEKELQELRLGHLKTVEDEKATLKATMAEMVAGEREKYGQLRAKLDFFEAEKQRLQDSYTTVQDHEVSLCREVKALQKTLSERDTVERNLREELQGQREALSSTETELQERLQTYQEKEANLLAQLNVRMQKIGCSPAENLGEAIDSLLNQTLPNRAAAQSSSTNDSFHTAKSRMTPNTSVPRTVSRSSDMSQAISEAVDLVQSITPAQVEPTSPPTEKPGTGLTQALERVKVDTQVSEYPRTGLTQTIDGIDFDETMLESTHSERNAKSTGSLRRNSNHMLAKERFRSHLGLDGLKAISNVAQSSQKTLPTTPQHSPSLRSETHDYLQHSNYSARRFSKTGYSIAQDQDARASEQLGGATQETQAEETAQTILRNASTAGNRLNQRTHDQHEAAAPNADKVTDENGTAPEDKLAETANKGLHSILKKRKADEDPQENTRGPARRRQRVPTAGLGPVISSPPTQSEGKAQPGPKSRKTPTRTSKPPDKWNRIYNAELQKPGKKR